MLPGCGGSGSSLGPGAEGARGSPWQRSGQGLAARAQLTTLPAAGQREGTRMAPALGIRHLSGARPGCRPAGEPSSGPMARQNRAVGSWRLALLGHCWGRGW